MRFPDVGYGPIFKPTRFSWGDALVPCGGNLARFITSQPPYLGRSLPTLGTYLPMLRSMRPAALIRAACAKRSTAVQLQRTPHCNFTKVCSAVTASSSRAHIATPTRPTLGNSLRRQKLVLLCNFKGPVTVSHPFCAPRIGSP